MRVSCIFWLVTNVFRKQIVRCCFHSVFIPARPKLYSLFASSFALPELLIARALFISDFSLTNRGLDFSSLTSFCSVPFWSMIFDLCAKLWHEWRWFLFADFVYSVSVLRYMKLQHKSYKWKWLDLSLVISLTSLLRLVYFIQKHLAICDITKEKVKNEDDSIFLCRSRLRLFYSVYSPCPLCNISFKEHYLKIRRVYVRSFFSAYTRIVNNRNVAAHRYSRRHHAQNVTNHFTNYSTYFFYICIVIKYI